MGRLIVGTLAAVAIVFALVFALAYVWAGSIG